MRKTRVSSEILLFSQIFSFFEGGSDLGDSGYLGAECIYLAFGVEDSKTYPHTTPIDRPKGLVRKCGAMVPRSQTKSFCRKEFSKRIGRDSVDVEQHYATLIIDVVNFGFSDR